MSDWSARNFLSVAELASKSATVADLSIDVRGLYLLAALRGARKEFDARATALETETLAAVAIGYGDDVGDLQADNTRGDPENEGQSGTKGKGSRPN